MDWDIDIETRKALICKMVDNLPVLRAAAGITQEDLANRLGITRQTVLVIERSASKLTWHMFLAMVYVFSANEKSCNLLNVLEIK